MLPILNIDETESALNELSGDTVNSDSITGQDVVSAAMAAVDVPASNDILVCSCTQLLHI